MVDGPVPKRLLVRAIGPALSAFGVAGALRDPRLRSFHEDRLVGDNDTWIAGDSSVERIANDVGAFALPYQSKDAALIITLPPGNYPAQITGIDGSAAIALLESPILP